MKTKLLLLASLWGSIAMAADYTLDFSGATLQEAEAPVLRRAEMAVAVGSVPAVVVGDMLNLKLFGDVDFAFKIVSAPPAGIAGQSFIAKDENGSASAIVKVTANTARISVDDFTNRRQYTVRCKDGKVLIVERDNSQADDGECGTCGGEIEVPQPVVEETTTTSAKKSRTLLGASGTEFPLAEQKSVVDILVAFDQGAKTKCSSLGFDGIEDCADYAVNKMNTVLEKSQLLDTFSYRLAGVTEIDDTYTSIGNQLLGNLRARVGALSRLTQLREKYGADTITLLIDKTQGNTTGIGYGYYPISSFPGPASFDGMNYACNVCDIKTVYSRYTMSHETGHNMGCDHSTRQGPTNSGPGRFEDSSGYHFVDANGVRRYTIMGYNYTDDDDYNYLPVPYFSSPDILPDEYGCAVGVEGTNNNRRTLLQTHADIAGLRDRKLPYDWDVRFLDDNGKDIADGTLFYGSTYVTLTNANPEAEIYYTLDGSTPTTESLHGGSGTNVYVYLVTGAKTLTACAVVNGKAQSVRSITLHDGHTWSGDENGAGLWLSGDSSVRPWNGEYFYNGDAVMFADLAEVSLATVTVKGAVSPKSVSFSAINTAYTFDKGDADANITIHNANFAPSGDLTFNVPVLLSATTFTNVTGCALTFNAPFGQTIDATSGYCTNLITISPYGTMTVAPGAGKTQTFDTLNNQNGGFSGNATFRVGEGTVVFKGAINGGAGVIGRTKLEVGNGGNLVFDMAGGGGTGYEMNQTSLTVEKGGRVTFTDMDLLKRVLYLDGGTIYAKRFDLMSNPGVYVTDDSSIENNTGGYILIRDSDSEIDVSNGKILTLNVGTQTDGRSDTDGWGIIKRGSGTLVANAELKHSGVTDVEDGSLEVGYSSGSTAYGQGWIVASNSTLRVKSGCSLKVPSLTLDETATISLPAASSAPLIVNGNVDLTEVKLSIQNVGDLSLGASYPLISATGEISGLKDFVRKDWPRPADGLGWKVAVSGRVLTASIVDIADADPYIDFTTNISGLRPTIPEDSTMSSAGGLQIGSSPIVIDGLDTKAVSIAVRFVVPETSPSDFATICSLRLGSNRINCMRNSSGELLGYYNDTTLTANSTSTVQLTTGEHLLQVGYYSESTAKGGTKMFLDGKVVYEATGLKFSSDSVSRVVFGATSGDTPIKPYTGLVIKEVAVLDVKSSLPPPHMTASGGDVSYELNVPDTRPRIFPLTPDGSVEMYETMLSASFSGTYEKLSVSVVAAFPAGATGTIFSVPLRPDDSYSKYATQVEYRGDGVLAFRDDGGSSLTTTCNVSADMTVPHLYTMTYTMGAGFKLYMDGEEVMSNTAYFQGKSLFIWERVVFGCGYWTNWMTSYNDNPNPMPNLKVYASHIALGTDDKAVSETAVKDATGYDPEESVEPDPEPPETPAIVDVLVAYDNGAQAYVANKGVTLSEFAQTQIDKMNDVLATNRLDRYYGYRLAGVCKVDGTYTNIDTAPGLIAAGEGPAVSLRAAREIYGADTVTLLVDTTSNTIGNSSPLNSTNNVASQHECAFSVCSIRAVDTGKQHTMIHENAHNMGCGHARAQGIINSPFEYGRGYYFKDGNVTRHTIMAYGGDNDASWYFSTTSKEFGFTLGDATNNNARVLKETCGEVAKWREGAAIPLADVEIPGVELETSSRFSWYVDDEGLVRSYNRTEYDGNQCTTPLKATIEGPRRLSFSHKSYFGGESVAGNNYSHFDVLLDDSPVFTQTECTNEWMEAYVDVPEGTHEVTFVFSQRFAMNNQSDYKEGEPDADDAVWLKDLALNVIPHSSTSDDVSWTFPDDAVATSDYLDGIILEKNGIKETLNFGSTNAVVLSVLAELPEGKVGEIAGCKIYRSDDAIFHAFAYSNGDGTFSLGHGTTTNQVTSSAGADWTALHVWTFAFVAQEGAYLYCDGKEIVKSTTIKWNQSSITNIVAFCDDPRSGWTISDAKIYVVHSDFGMEEFSNVTNTPASNASAILSQFACLADYADESLDNKLALLSLYKEKGSIPDQSVKADSCVLRISEIMPKPTDARTLNGMEGLDVNGLESGWVEVENTSDKWADLADYRFIRVNRGKKTDPAGFGNFPSRLVPPHGRAIFYTSERYANSKDITVSAWATPDPDGNVPKIYADFNNVLVWPDKVNPKKSPYVRLYYAPGGDSDKGTVVDTVVIPSDLPEGWSIIVGDAAEGEGTRRWMCPTPTRGTANTATANLTRIGPNVGPLYERPDQKKTDLASEFAAITPPAVPGTDYTVTLPINAVMNPDGTFTPRTADQIQAIKFVYRKDLDDTTLVTNNIDMAAKTTDANWGDQYKATIPASYFPAAGHLMQWKVLITDGEGVEWTSPSFNNKDDGYEWYGTIVEPGELNSATLPTWHMFATGYHLTQMDVDADKQDRSLVPNQARIAIYDSSTSNYYDYVRIDLRGNTSAGFTKKGHGLRFAKAHPLTMRDIVSGEDIEEIRKTSLISEFADPSFMRQMIAFWLWRKMGNLVPFDFPVRCNLNGEFYQLAFNSERFTDELIEDVYGLDKFGYSYKNVGKLWSSTSGDTTYGTSAGGIEKKTPDDENESDISVLQNELRSKITAAQNVSGTSEAAKSSITTDAIGLDNAALTKFVVQKFDLPAWLNYLASAKITQEMDDVWANICVYYDNPDMLDGDRGKGTWMPLGYDFNISFGQYYQGDIGSQIGLMSNQDWFKSHPFYGGNRVRCWKQSGMTGTCNYGNDGFEAVWQSAKFRRLYLRRLRTLMDQELKEPGTPESEVPFMVKMREMADLMRADSVLDLAKWPDDGSDNAIDVWPSEKRPEDMDAGITEIWNDYVVPRREHLYVTHSVTNTAKAIGYGSNLNAGIPESQSPIEILKAGFSVDNTMDETMTAIVDSEKVVIRNSNAEAVDMSGWQLTGRLKMTLPAGAVVDADDTITVVVDRRSYITDSDSELTDQVIIGNATLNADSTTLLLTDADGVKVLQVAPPSDESLYLRLHSFDGIPPLPSKGDTDEWIALTNISETATLDLAGVRVVFCKAGDTTPKCDFTIQEGQIAPLGSVTVRQSDYAATGWTKITNGELTIAVYDANGLVAHAGGVVQKDYKSYRDTGGPGGEFYIRLTQFGATFASGDFEEVAYPVTTVEVVPGEDAALEAATPEEAAAALADCEIALTAEDKAAGLVTNVLKLVAVPVVSVDPLTSDETISYVARVDVDETKVSAPVIAEPAAESEPVEVEEDKDGNKSVSVSISNAVLGLWYGYGVADELGKSAVFTNDIDSFERATNATHKVKGSPRTKPSGFFRIKVLPNKPKP